MAAEVGEEFARRTDGRVKIELSAASLGPPPKQFDMVISGVADLAFTNHGYTPGQFPLTGIVGLPFLGDKAEALSVAYWRVHEKYFAAVGEHKRVKLIGLSTHGGGPIFSQKPITKVSDLAGLKMIATNGTLVKMARTLDVAPVMATPPKWFELMSRGVVDGGLISTDAPPKFKITKFVPYYTIVPGGLYNSSFPVIMNLKKWNKLSAADRQALEPLFGEPLSRKGGNIWDTGEAWARSQFPKVGIKTSTADAAFVNELRDRLSGFVAAWIERAGQKGIDGEAALKMFKAETAKEEAKL
jgi:TRAP-type C4-dicarboxylate transport system substrate-binding protein